jgi:HK97 family phage portal protein
VPIVNLLQRLLGFEERSHDPLDPDATYPDIDAQLYARQRAHVSSRPAATIGEALGIPAIFRAVTLLSTVAASLQLKEYVNGREVTPAAPVIRRPQRAWTPGAFTRQTVLNMAAYGEAIWIVKERDAGGLASDLVPVKPTLLKSDFSGIVHDWYTYDRNGKRFDYNRADVVHIPFIQDPGDGRGRGPLQMCGVATNVAVEAEYWASRFFVGSIPSVFLESKVPLAGDDPATIKDKWLTDPPNVPKVGYGIEPHVLPLNPETAQLTASRMYSRGDAALMFGIPGRMLEYSESGSSITYANVGDLATELVRLTLSPVYLEQIEQAFSDLRPRGTEVRYDVEGFERADAKTRYEIHEKAIGLGMYDAEYAARAEGISGEFPEVRPAPLRVVNG